MLKHSDIDTIHDNLFELAQMINYKSSDPYIKSMYQYIVNPLAWIVTEKAVRISEKEEGNSSTSHNTSSDEICSDNPCDYCNKEGNCTITKSCHDQFSGRKLHTC